LLPFSCPKTWFPLR